MGKKIKAYHTRYRALSPELIPVYRQSARRCTKSPFNYEMHQPCGRLPLLSAMPAVTFPAGASHRPLASTKLYCLVTEAHRCEQLGQGCYAAFAPSTSRISNPRPVDRKSNALPVAPPRHQKYGYF